MATNPLIQALIGTEGLIAPQKPKDLFASMLIKNGLQTGPVGHWTEGAARMAQALLGGLELREQEGNEADRKAAPDRLSAIIEQTRGGGMAPQAAPRPQMPSVAPTGFAPSAPPMAGAPPAAPQPAAFADRFNAISDDPRRQQPDNMTIPPSQVARANGQPPSAPVVAWGDGVQGNDPRTLPPPGQPVPQQMAQAPQSGPPPGGLDMRTIQEMRKDSNKFVRAIGNQKFMEEILRSPEYDIKTDNGVTIAVDKRDPRRRYIIDDPQFAQTLIERKAREQYAVTTATERAKAETEAGSVLPQARGRMETTVRAIDELRNHPGRAHGFSSLAAPYMLGTPQFDFVERVKQIQGGAFLQAFEMLKGGGQITQVEGEKATQAIARLNRANSRQAFDDALNDFETAVRDGYAKLQEKARGGAMGQSPQPEQRVRRYNPQTGRIE